MNQTDSGIQEETAPRPARAGVNTHGPCSGDAAVRDRLRGALERELASATAAGDQAARERLLASLQSVITR